jgi:YD repeat-containing protein
MKQNLKLMLLAVALIAASCSKSKDEPKDEILTCQLSEKASGNLKTNYAYNSDGKLASVKEGDYQETYTYTANSLTWKFIEPSGSTATTTYTLDAQGLAITSTEGAINNTFTYDANGYLTEVRSDASWIGTIKYTWANGNLTKIEQTKNGSTTTTSFEYNTESRPTGFGLDYLSANENIWHDGDRQILSNGNFGKQPKNLVSKASNITYTYTKDGSGNITKMVTKQGTNETALEFKYNCK